MYELIPEGWYDATVAAIALDQSKTGTKCFKIAFTLPDGKKITHRAWLSDKALEYTAGDLYELGFVATPESIVGSTARLKVYHEENAGKKYDKVRIYSTRSKSERENPQEVIRKAKAIGDIKAEIVISLNKSTVATTTNNVIPF